MAKTKSKYEVINFGLMAFFVISLFLPSFPIKMLAISLMALSFLIQPVILIKLKSFISNPLSWLLVGYYLMHLLGYAFSSNKEAAGHYLEIRAAFLVFPLVFFVGNISSKKIQAILLIFAASTILFSLIGLLYRTYFYIFEISDSGYFYNDNIIDIFSMQAVYYAVYVNIAIFILLHFMLAKQQIVRLPNWTLLVAITYLVVVNFLLASRLSMLSLYLMLLVYLIVFIIKQRKYVLGGGLLLAGLAMVVALFVFFPKTIKRFESVKNTKFDFENTNPINHFNGEISETNWNGANTRLAIWTCAWEVIEDNFWLGVGPGAYSDKLNEKYMEKNFHFGLQRQYGTHNMYLQTWMMFGFLGFLFFLAFLLIPLFMALRQGEYLYAVFLVFIMLAMLTEDFFSRNQGILLFAFFNSLFAMQILQREKPKQLN